MVDYVCRHLTFPCDKLPAIQGLANAMPCPPGVTYLAGHWAGPCFVESLLWSTEPATKSYKDAAVTIAPSWSWASVYGPVQEWELHPFEPMLPLAMLLPVEPCDEIAISRVSPQAGLKLLMSAAIHSLGDAPTDLLLFRKPLKHYEPAIALKTAWLPNGLLQPQTNKNITVKDPWGAGDERPMGENLV